MSSSPNRLPWYGLSEFSVLKPSVRAEPIAAICNLVIALHTDNIENPLPG